MTRKPLPAVATALFDVQSGAFDLRAALPADAVTRVSAAVIEVAALGRGRSVFEMGVGTGQIGLEFVTAGIPYLGMDVAPGMIDAFRAKAARAGRAAELVVGDGNARWPVPNGSVSAVFGSRSLHWLRPEHAASEAFRVAAPPYAVLLIGRVVHDPDGPRGRIRRAMRNFLREAGHEGRRGRAGDADLVERCVERGAARISERTVAEFSVHRPPRASLDDWRGKPGLAGTEVPSDVKADILERLTRWTSETFGNIDHPMESRERYTLEGAVLLDQR